MACVEPLEGVVVEARACYCEGRYVQAEKLYTQALAAFTPHRHIQKLLVAQIHNERGVCRYKLVYFDEAVQDYTQALALNPALAAAYYHRATIHYRLLAGHPKGSSRRQTLGQQAMEDFKEAVRRDPNNIEFKEGLQSCRDEIEADGDDVKVLDLEDVPLPKRVKLLFLLDNGDKETGTTPVYKEENAAAARQAKETFQAILMSREDGNQIITELLQTRAKELLSYEILILPEGTEAASHSVRKQDEDLLILAEGCHHLGIEYNQALSVKIKKVQKKMELNDKEKEGNFFIYAENLLMNHICDNLTADLVYRLFRLFIHRYRVKLGLHMDSDMTVQDKLEFDGVKEALFFYIIREMEEQNLLNRIYTDKLRDFFEELQGKNGKDENLSMAIAKLKSYPEECRPAGLCLVFCVTEDREGADSEIVKIRSVFEDHFKFTVKIERNPNCDTLDRYKKELIKTKYRFYDSLVIWFVSHGDETNLILSKEENINREKFIDDFSIFSNFSKKPKIFFMATCRGNKPICADEAGETRGDLGGTEASSDVRRISQDGPSGNKGCVGIDVPESCQDISRIYYQMDRLVAYATLPSNISFRLKDEGSVFVDTVCSLLEENQGENITQVLEGVSRLIHQIVFKSDEDKFVGESKQACFYESTFQKTFLIPKI
ncbi:Caspase-14 [Chionoecetes opilio]|uniref:Caspase-14 n=1 Tax=Chionoecetes opilio TaxID=41210 RepID=A0A8J4XM91_CHIOP|nr:Caspase-14 [Chionoecetes opilio]